jgi:hypothetical protein
MRSVRVSNFWPPAGPSQSPENVGAAWAALAPQLNPSTHAEFVGDETDILGQVKLHRLRVAAADVEVIEVGQNAEGFDRFLHPAVPFFFPTFS